MFQAFLQFLELFLTCGTVLGLAFIIALSLPQSRFQMFVLEILYWLGSVAAAVYCVSPVDFLPEIVLGPFGAIDDIGVLVGGVWSCLNAVQTRKARNLLY